jgi:RNase P/RNase MRP subunit POP5
MKALKPSARENKRYLTLKGKNLKENVEAAVKDFVGALGLSKASMKWIDVGKDKGVLAVNREALNSVRASFAVWPEKIDVLGVSGTLKGLKK